MNFARFNDVDAIQNSLFFGSEALRVLSLEAALDNLGIAENGSWEVSVSPNLKLNTMIRFKRCRNSKIRNRFQRIETRLFFQKPNMACACACDGCVARD